MSTADSRCGLVIITEKLESMDLSAVSNQFTGYLPTGDDFKFRCVPQLPIAMLDVNFYKQKLLNRHNVPWTTNWSISFPSGNLGERSSIFPMAGDTTVHKDGGEVFLFPAIYGEDVRIHTFGVVTFPWVLYGVPITVQCLLVGNMEMIPLPGNAGAGKLLLDIRLFDGEKVPLLYSLNRTSFMMKRGSSKVCVAFDISRNILDAAICLTAMSSCIEYGKHTDAGEEGAGGAAGGGEIQPNGPQPEDPDFIEDPAAHRKARMRPGPKPWMNEDLLGELFCGVCIYYGKDSQFNIEIELDNEEIDCKERADIRMAIETIRSINNIFKHTGFSFRKAIVSTDSIFLCNALQLPTTVTHWAEMGWRTDSGHPIEHQDLWEEYLDDLKPTYPILWHLCPRDPKVEAKVLARKCAMQNIYICETTTAEAANDREREFPPEFIVVEDTQAEYLYEKFTTDSQNETAQRIGSAFYDGGICAKDLPVGFHCMIDCRESYKAAGRPNYSEIEGYNLLQPRGRGL
ncbi:RNA-DNA hybrid ribonuclease [Orbilia blumenaviensis]|uniref:RNA-DNA hybrid ribonuclease n=1 Tax=Orbilia blumenaviensis TaxID=1796055 RepID=A0AAV9UK19_9PEZI